MRSRPAVIGVCLTALLTWGCSRRVEMPPQELARYSSKISFTNFRASAAENLARHTIYYIDAEVKNDTGRPIALLQVRASFYDVDGQFVFREPALVVKENQPPLPSGQSREFRMAFEGLPAAWGRTAPRLEITRLVFE
jgi:hypothetical protein